MNVNRNLVLTGLLAVALAAGLVWAADQSEGPLPPGPPAQSPGFGPAVELDPFADLAYDPTVVQQLGITAAQAEQLRALRREAAKFRIRQRADMALKRMELQELLAAETPDRALIETKLREISDLQHALLKSRIDSRLALQDVLTPEQRTKMRALRGQRRRGLRMRGMRHMRRRGMRMRGMSRRPMGMWPRFRRAPVRPPEPPPPPEPPQP